MFGDDDAAALEPLVPGSSICAPTNPVQAALASMPIATLYEAVEQLRAFAADNPAAAEKLLAGNPQLRLAVVLVMQHAKVLPETLPPEATAALAPSPVAPVAGADAAIQALAELSEAELQEIMSLSPEDLAKLPEPTRSQLTAIQTQLKALSQAT